MNRVKVCVVTLLSVALIVLLFFGASSLYVLKSINNWDRFVYHYHATCVYEGGYIICTTPNMVINQIQQVPKEEITESIYESDFGKKNKSSIFQLAAMVNKNNSGWEIFEFLRDLGVPLDDSIYGCNISNLREIFQDTEFNFFIDSVEYLKTSDISCDLNSLRAFVLDENG